MSELIEQYRQLHAAGAFKGLSVLKFADEIRDLCGEFQAKTLLDYGSGQGWQYLPPHSLDKKWGVDVTMYDPAVDGLDQLPESPFDAVVCSDVVEHLPSRADAVKVLHDVFKRAKKFVFVTACCRPAKKTLPDGRNVHLLLMGIAEWTELVCAVAQVYPDVKCRLRETP